MDASAAAATRIGHAPDHAGTTLDRLADNEPAMIVDPTPVGPTDLLGMVKVTSSHGFCSGTVIGADTVLTSAHCVCTLNWTSSNTCVSTATVAIRADPAVPGSEFSMTGSVTVIPGYNPAWTQQVIQEDLAIIKLPDPVPRWAKPFEVAQSYLPVGTTVRVAGFGHTGQDCDGPLGTLNSDLVAFDDYEDANHEKEVLRFDDRALCPGDSGGAILDPSNEHLHAVHSMHTLLVSHGSVNKSTTTTQHFNWIKSNMCFSTARNTCDGWGSPCNCSADDSILWQASTGAMQVWFMNGGFIDHSALAGGVPTGFTIQGTGDFNGYGHGDVLLRHSDGTVRVRFLLDGWYNGDENRGQPGNDWTIQGVADFDGNAQDDILWRHTNGQLAIWPNGSETGATFPTYFNGGTPTPTNWLVRGLGDFNGDGQADILWRISTSTAVAIWTMSGGTHLGELSRPDPGSAFSFARIGDLDGNLKDDVLWRHSTTGAVLLWPDGAPNSVAPTAFLSYDNSTSPPPTTWTLLGLGDFDHDGRDDVLWRNVSTGQIAVWIMEGARVVADLYPSTVDSTWTYRGIVHDDNN